MDAKTRELLTDVHRFLDSYPFGEDPGALQARVKFALDDQPVVQEIQTLPRSLKVGHCKKCGAPFFFARTLKGNWTTMVPEPIEADASDLMADAVSLRFTNGEAQIVRGVDTKTRWIPHPVFCSTTEWRGGPLQNLWERTQGAYTDKIAEGLTSLLNLVGDPDA